MKNYLYKNIQTNFLIGSPTQNVQISACLGEYSTFIIQKGSKGFNKTMYNKNISETYISYTEKPEFYLFQIFNKGMHSIDNFIIENSKIEINNLGFLLATEVGINQCHIRYCEILTEPGILGFLLKEKYDEINITQLNFIKQLKQKEIISGYEFNFHFESENSGNIIIGEKPHEYDNIHYNKENYFTTKITLIGNDIDWWLSFDKIYYGDEETSNQKQILLRIEYGLIMGDFPWQKILENNFFNKLINESICFKNKTMEKGNILTYYYCNKNADLNQFKPFTFIINDFNNNFTLSKDDLFLEEKDKYIFLMVFGKYDLIFGHPFFKKYQLVFNPDSKTIGFYTKIKNDLLPSSFSSLIYYIVIIILVILLFSLLGIIIFCNLKGYKNKKKNADELINEENDNIIDEKNKIFENDNNDINYS